MKSRFVKVEIRDEAKKFYAASRKDDGVFFTPVYPTAH
jgi:hypothetical protein